MPGGIDARGIQFQRTDNLRIEDIVLLNDINWSTFISESDNVNISNYKVVAVENPNNRPAARTMLWTFSDVGM